MSTLFHFQITGASLKKPFVKLAKTSYKCNVCAISLPCTSAQPVHSHQLLQTNQVQPGNFELQNPLKQTIKKNKLGKKSSTEKFHWKCISYKVANNVQTQHTTSNWKKRYLWTKLFWCIACKPLAMSQAIFSNRPCLSTASWSARRLRKYSLMSPCRRQPNNTAKQLNIPTWQLTIFCRPTMKSLQMACGPSTWN